QRAPGLPFSWRWNFFLFRLAITNGHYNAVKINCLLVWKARFGLQTRCFRHFIDLQRRVSIMRARKAAAVWQPLLGFRLALYASWNSPSTKSSPPCAGPEFGWLFPAEGPDWGCW